MARMGAEDSEIHSLSVLSASSAVKTIPRRLLTLQTRVSSPKPFARARPDNKTVVAIRCAQWWSKPGKSSLPPVTDGAKSLKMNPTQKQFSLKRVASKTIPFQYQWAGRGAAHSVAGIRSGVHQP
jgi:hypothetical protein